MPTSFLNLPQQGKTETWRFLLGLFVIFFCWFVLGSLPALTLAFYASVDENPETFINLSTGLVDGIHPMLNLLVLLSSFWFLILGLIIAVRLLHQRPFLTLITPYKSISWRRLRQGFGVYLGLIAAATLVEYLLRPDIYVLTFNPTRFWPFLVLMLLLIPIQTSAEELFFRGYLLQTLGRGTRNVGVLTAVNGFIFMLPHLSNPEVATNPLLLALYFWGIGGFFAWITLKDNRLELALGAHAANNLFSGIFANYTNSVLVTESIFTVSELDPTFALISLIIIVPLFYLIVRPGDASQHRDRQIEAMQ